VTASWLWTAARCSAVGLSPEVLDRFAGEIERTLVAVLSEIQRIQVWAGLQFLVEIKQRFSRAARHDCNRLLENERRRQAAEYGATKFLTRPVDLELLKAHLWHCQRPGLRKLVARSNDCLYGAFPVKWCFSVYCQFFVRSGKAVPHPVAYDQVPGARAMGSRDRNASKA
jgi:hypothetical protein